MLLPLAACAPIPPEDTPEASVCPTDLAVGEIVVQADFADGTEGVAFPGAWFMVTVPDGVMAYSEALGWSRFATLPHALGLAPAADGVLVADPGAFDFSGTDADGRLLSIGWDGVVAVLAEGMPNPNAIVAGPGDTLLVSDDTSRIYAVADGGFTTWLDTVPSPNGMAWSPDGTALYVVSTFVPDPPLWRVPLVDGVPGTPEVVTTFPTGAAPDGLAVDAEGGVWVALNVADEVVRVDPATGAQTARVTGITSPASLAFGAADGFDPCSLYVTELRGDHVWRLATGVEGG